MYVCRSVCTYVFRSLCRSLCLYVVRQFMLFLSYVLLFVTYVFSIVICLCLYDVLFLYRCSSCLYVLRVSLCVPFRPSVRMYLFLYVLVCRSFIYVVRSFVRYVLISLCISLFPSFVMYLCVPSCVYLFSSFYMYVCLYLFSSFYMYLCMCSFPYTCRSRLL